MILEIDIIQYDLMPSTEVECENETLAKYYCSNGGKCMEVKTWPDQERNPDDYKLSLMHCHCAEGWTGKRCQERFFNPDDLSDESTLSDFSKQGSAYDIADAILHYR